MILGAPERLWLLLPAVLIVCAIAWKRRRPYLAHPLLTELRAELRPARRLVYLPKALEWAALGVLAFALLQPLLPSAQYTVSSDGLDIVLVVDLSSSMQEPMDLAGALRRERMGIVQKEKTRLEAVKEAMVRFAQTRHTDRLGVVVFSEEGYVVVPMTTDIPYVVRYLRMVDTATLAGEGQTAIGEGIATAQELVDAKAPAHARTRKGKVIVVLTDGENNAGRDPVEALKSARAAGFRVHFIGVEVEKAKNAPQLIAGVHATGGKYYDVRKESELLAAYLDIDRMEKTRFVSTRQITNVPYYAPFALVAVGLLLASLLLRTRAYFTEIS